MKGSCSTRVLIGLLLALSMALLLLIVRALYGAGLGAALQGPLHSEMFADYSADPDDWQFGVLDPAIVADAIRDEFEGGDVPPEVATIIAYLETPVPTVTPDGRGGVPAASVPTDTPTPTNTPTPTDTPTPTSTPTPTPTDTPIPTSTPSATPSEALPTDTLPPPPPPPTDTPTVVPAPDLATASRKTASLSVMYPTDQISYTVIVRNTGSLVAADVTVQDTVPFTLALDTGSISGPPHTLSGGTITWGPFDVPPGVTRRMGFAGWLGAELPFTSPSETMHNRAVVSAPWLKPALFLDTDVVIRYPPEMWHVSGSLAPATAAQADVVTLALQVENWGGAWANLSTGSYLTLMDTSSVVLFTTPLAAPTLLPADTQPYTLTFGSLLLSPVPTGTLWLDLHLEWTDENGDPGSQDLTSVAQLTVNPGPMLLVLPSPAPMTTVVSGTLQVFQFTVWNGGPVTGDVHLSADYVEVTFWPGWVNVGAPTPSAFNFPCGGNALWTHSVAGQSVQWMIPGAACGSPYPWAPDVLPPTTNYVELYADATAPATTGIYTVTVRTSLNNGAILHRYDIPYQVVP